MGRVGARASVWRWARLPGALLMLAGSVGVVAWSGVADPIIHHASPEAPTVLFVVLDTVRADRLSACGYERPTTPNLERLVREGAQLSCDAYAPASWTLPSHASFFTGTELPEHGVGMVSEGDAMLPWGSKIQIRSFEPEVPTLAERFAERGYQTVALSANPVVGPTTGLLRGFEVQRVGGFRGPRLQRQLEDLLSSEVDPERPLFLYVNVIDAHEPWPAVPDDVDWLPARDRVRLRQWERDDPKNRFVTGRMTPDEAAAFRAHVGDVYDHAVWHADAALGSVLETLTGYGWLDEGSRIVLTSDHGELLGEHDYVGHTGTKLYEPVTRVPLLVMGADVELPPSGTPMSALHAYDLVLEGRLGADRPARTAAFPNPKWPEWFGLEPTTPAGALRVGRHKLLRVDGETSVYDLGADPGEQRPLDAADHPAREALEDFVERVVEAHERDAPTSSDEAQEQLRALGYVE